MNLEEFYTRNEFLYHLTSKENADIILASRMMLSTRQILAGSDLSDQERTLYLTERRPDHVYVNLISGGTEVMIRDQRPISTKALGKCLTDGWSVEQFITSLNSRVFFWPTLKRLQIHFDRYESEEPKIIRVRSKDLIEGNAAGLRLCHLNSGATRCHPKWKAPPPRGANTFVTSEDWDYPVRAVAEVTFETECDLPDEVWVSDHPNGPWTEANL